MRIDRLFDLVYGKRGIPFNQQEVGDVRFISSQGKKRGVQGMVALEPNAKWVITVPRVGTICEAFFQNLPCVCNENVIIMKPKTNLSEREMIYYSLCVRQYKSLFVYGRQVTPTRLGELEIPSPDEIPSWVYEMEIPTFDDISEAKNAEKVELPPVSEWKSFRYDELFDIKKATGPKISEVKKTEGKVPYVSATAENNGIVHYGNFVPTMKGNCITVGHLGDCFYQEEDFSGSNVTALIPKFELTKERAMFLITLLNANKFKYNYGRVIGITRLKGEQISLPINETGTPDWQLIEDYINSLPYSRYL